MTERRRPENAFTLVEMLVVISIIVMIFAIGTAFVAFSQSKYQVQATANNLMSSLRRARSEALTTRSPVSVVLRKRERQQGQILFYPEMPVASWEFDDREQAEEEGIITVPGAFGQKMKCRDQVKFVVGSTGAALEFQNTSSSRSNRNKLIGRCMHSLNLTHRASEGFIIRLTYWTGEIMDNTVLLARKNLFSIGLDKDARFVTSVGALTAIAEEPSPPDTWIDVRITFRKGTDGPDRLTIHQNNRKIAEAKGDAELYGTGSEGPAAQLSSEDVQLGIFPGRFSRVRIDRLRYSRIIEEELGTIAKPVRLEGDRRITFQSDGTAGPSRIDLSRKGLNRSIRLQVHSTGAVERIDRNTSSGPGQSTAPSGGKNY